MQVELGFERARFDRANATSGCDKFRRSTQKSRDTDSKYNGVYTDESSDDSFPWVLRYTERISICRSVKYLLPAIFDDASHAGNLEVVYFNER